jgi:type IV fimbrial biogenesis protein FimT
VLTSLHRRGFTIVEMMVALTIAAILLVLAAPMYSVWMADSQIQSAAESIASGLRFAQYQAVARNTSTQLVLNPATGAGGWTVTQVSDGSTLRTDSFRTGADRAAFAVTPAGNTTVTYTALGLIAAANADATAPFSSVDVTIPAVVGSRPLRVVLGDPGVPGGAARVKICDPSWPATDPKGCP